jgi:hypothetical protein
VLNNAGQTAFYAATTDGGLGLWSEGSGSLAPVARSGDHAPGTPNGVNFTFTNLHDFVETPVLNDAGQTSFRSYLSGPGVNANNLQGLWSEGSGSIRLLSRLGTHAPGLPAGVNHGYAFSAGLNDAGQSVFFSFLAGSGVNNSNDRSLWMENSGSPTLLARTGSQAPGMPSGVNFNAFYNTASINNAGQAVFVAGLSSENSEHRQDSLWMADAGTLKLLARRGSQASGAPDGVTYDLFGAWPESNDAGQAVFLAVLMGPGIHENNDVALFLMDAQGNTSQIAREGFQAPGTPAGTVFTPGANPIYNAPVLNNGGQIAYMAALAGPEVNSTNDFGIWATDRAGATQLIVRKGDLLEVVPGDSRTVSELSFVGGNSNSNGWPSAFNNVGQIAFWASFTDGSQGVFVSNEVATVPGDFNFDGTVDTGDYVAWRNGLGTLYSQSHYNIWRAHFGQTPADSLSAPAGTTTTAIPEPPAFAVILWAIAGLHYGSGTPPRRAKRSG